MAPLARSSATPSTTFFDGLARAGQHLSRPDSPTHRKVRKYSADRLAKRARHTNHAPRFHFPARRDRTLRAATVPWERDLTLRADPTLRAATVRESVLS